MLNLLQVPHWANQAKSFLVTTPEGLSQREALKKVNKFIREAQDEANAGLTPGARVFEFEEQVLPRLHQKLHAAQFTVVDMAKLGRAIAWNVPG
jgi:hypothetical protein